VLRVRVVDRHGAGPGQPEDLPVSPFWLAFWLLTIVELAIWAVVLWAMAIRTLL
jgi:hypothetical protein